MRGKIKHLDSDKDRHGNPRLYYRNRNLNGRRIRLRGPKGSPEFWEDYLAAAKSEDSQTPSDKSTGIQKDTIRALVVEYYTSARYRQLADSTKRVRRGILDRFCHQHGDKRFSKLQPKHLIRIRNQMADRPESANGLIKALRQVFEAAIELTLIDNNPAASVKLLKSNNSEGFHAWTIAEVEQFEATHPIGSKARLALALFLYTGQRRSDVVRMGRQHVRDGWINIRQVKTKALVDIPILNELQKIIDASPTGDLTYIVTSFDKPFTSNGFGNRMRKWCDEAGLPQCSAHGLRKAMATRLADLGCSTHEIMSIGGWETLKEVERYTKQANRKRLAGQVKTRIDG
jgi:integrase